MFVAITGIRVPLALCEQRVIFDCLETDSLLRAVVYAGEAQVAIATGRNAGRFEHIIPSRTNIGTDTASDTSVRYIEIFLTPFQKSDIRV